jgi:predicted PurR-regulated permease PerM
MKQNIQLIDVPIRTFIKFFLVVGLIWSAWIVKSLIVAILVALIIATPTSNLADKLRKYYIPRGMTAFATLLALVAILVGIIVLFVPMLSGEISRFADTLPQFQVEIRNMVNTFTRTNDIQNLIGKVTSTDVANASQSAISFLTSTLGATASAATSFIVQLLIIFVLAFYLAVRRRGIQARWRPSVISKKDLECGSRAGSRSNDDASSCLRAVWKILRSAISSRTGEAGLLQRLLHRQKRSRNNAGR